MPFVPAKCTQCGANIEVDPSKDAGICKYCGTAFVTEKAINNYNVNITNNFDGANINVLGGDIENLITLGQAALDVGNGQEAYDYSNRALELDSKSAKAWFLKMSAIGSMATIEDTKTDEIISYGLKAIEVSDDGIEKDVYIYWSNVSNSLLTVATNYLADVTDLRIRLHNDSSAGHLGIGHEDLQYRHLFVEMESDAIKLALSIPKSYCDKNDFLVENYILIANQYLQFCEKDVARTELYNKYVVTEKLLECRKENLLHITNRIPAEKRDQIIGPEMRLPKSGGCYIATAVYGSYNCPEVWTLRRFRDYYLDEHALGRLFIKCYYMLSPALVRKYGDAKWFQITWRRLLNSNFAQAKQASTYVRRIAVTPRKSASCTVFQTLVP